MLLQLAKQDVQLLAGRTGQEEGRVLFNDTLNTFCLWLYGVRLMVNDYSDSERERKETCCCHYMGYSFQLAARNLLYAPFHRQNSTYHIAFVISVVEHWMEREPAQWVHQEGSTHRGCSTTELHLASPLV